MQLLMHIVTSNMLILLIILPMSAMYTVHLCCKRSQTQPSRQKITPNTLCYFYFYKWINHRINLYTDVNSQQTHVLRYYLCIPDALQ